MPTYGVTGAGFVIKPQTQIVQDFEDAETSTIDPGMNTGAQTPLGQLNSIYASALAELWEVAQVAYNGLNRDDAEGPALDNIGDLDGDLRLGPKPSSVYCNCTLLAVNSPYAVGALVCNVTGIPTSQFSNVLEVTVPTDGVYSVLMASLTDGPVEATAGTLIVITAPVTGWSAVTNPLDATPGSLLETDPDYRERQREELAIGGGTKDAIQAALLQTPGVVSATVLENTTDAAIGGLPAHSFECIVWDGSSGGTNVSANALAQVIWNQKPSGIATYGVTSGTAFDSDGNPQTVNFTRSTELLVYMAYTVTLAPGAVLATVAPLLKQTVVYLSNGFQSDGVTPLTEGIPGLLSPGTQVTALVYRAAALAVPGVTDVPNLALDYIPSPTATANLAVPAVDIANLDTSRITVNGI